MTQQTIKYVYAVDGKEIAASGLSLAKYGDPLPYHLFSVRNKEYINLDFGIDVWNDLPYIARFRILQMYRERDIEYERDPEHPGHNRYEFSKFYHITPSYDEWNNADRPRVEEDGSEIIGNKTSSTKF